MTWKIRDFRYDWASITAPIFALTIILVYQHMSYGDFWRSVNPISGANDTAGAIQLYAEIVEILYTLLVGSVIGGCLALKEMSLRSRKPKIAILSLCLNGSLALLSLFYLSREWTLGL